jgi:hypothetical protein
MERNLTTESYQDFRILSDKLHDASAADLPSIRADYEALESRYTANNNIVVKDFAISGSSIKQPVESRSRTARLLRLMGFQSQSSKQ